MFNLPRIQNAVLILLMGLLVSFCTVQRSPVTGNKRAYGYSWEQEVQIGKKSDKQIQQQYGVYQDESLQQYIKRIGKKVLSKSHLRREDTPAKYKNTEFHFRVLNSEIPNAFALPGGYVYVTRGLLAHLENEAQLAVVLGHEIGHVAARHASQRALEQQVGQLALVGGAVGGEILGLPGGDILQLGSQAAQLLFLSYSRDDERESDRLGVEYAAMEHYDAARGAGFFSALERISEQSGQSLPAWQSTHPDPGERQNTIPRLAQKWKEKGYEQNIVDTDQYMQKIDGLVYGKNPREGFTRNGVFYHPELKFQFPYPRGWKLINQTSVVQMVNDDQNAIILFQIDAKNDSPRASVKEFLSQDGVEGIAGNDLSNNGLNAYEATAKAQAKGGADVKLYLYSVAYDGNVYRYVAYTLADQFDSYSDEFKRTTSNFRKLADRSILNIQPVRLQVSRTNRSGTFDSFVPENLPMDITEQDVAITNQVQLNEKVSSGQWIKIPQK